MRIWGKGSIAVLLSATLGLIAPALSSALAAPNDETTRRLPAAGSIQSESARIPATARYTGPLQGNQQPDLAASGRGFSQYALSRKGRLALQSFGISCVPYARQASGIIVAGNAWQRWENASGLYARGDRPEAGSVLNFRANPRMPLGHVAVVDRVINAREIEVQHANWGYGVRGRITHGVTIVDVSEANNWSAVRVELGRGEDFGSVYPTYGFIYNRADTGVITASIHRPAPQPDINPVPSDLRPRAEQPWRMYEEVAEASQATPRRIDLRVPVAINR